MTIKLTDDTVGLWFVTIPEADGQVKTDWLASVWKDEDGMLQLRCRFRHYRDDKTFDSNDEKNWYDVEIGNTDVDQAIETVRKLVQGLWQSYGGKRYEVLMGEGGIDALTRAWMRLPFNTRTIETFDPRTPL